MEYELGTYLKVGHSIEIGAIVGVLLVDEGGVGIYLSLDLVLVQEEVVEGRVFPRRRRRSAFQFSAFLRQITLRRCINNGPIIVAVGYAEYFRLACTTPASSVA